MPTLEVRPLAIPGVSGHLLDLSSLGDEFFDLYRSFTLPRCERGGRRGPSFAEGLFAGRELTTHLARGHFERGPRFSQFMGPNGVTCAELFGQVDLGLLFGAPHQTLGLFDHPRAL